MTLPQLYAWAASGGFPACLALGLWLLMTGRIRLSREIEKSEQDNAAERIEWQRQIADLRRDLEKQLVDMTKDRDYYRDTSMELLKRYSNEVETSEAAVRVAARGMSHR